CLHRTAPPPLQTMSTFVLQHSSPPDIVPLSLHDALPISATTALLAFGGDGTLLRSTDGGQNWQQVASNTTQELRDAVLEPKTGHLLITGRDGKVIRSADGGISWQPLQIGRAHV